MGRRFPPRVDDTYRPRARAACRALDASGAAVAAVADRPCHGRTAACDPLPLPTAMDRARDRRALHPGHRDRAGITTTLRTTEPAGQVLADFPRRSRSAF